MLFNTIILAGGEGTRMKSPLPKVLHQFQRKPMIIHVIDTVLSLGSSVIYIVVGRHREIIEATIQTYFPRNLFLYIDQSVPLGTGHAIQECLPYLQPSENILILNADVPNVKPFLLESFMKNAPVNSLISMSLENPFGYGRVFSNEQNQIDCIVEEKDCTETQKHHKIVNSGIYFFSSNILHQYTPYIRANIVKGEYYLTDLIEICARHGVPVHQYLLHPSQHKYLQGVNTIEELQNLEKL